VTKPLNDSRDLTTAGLYTTDRHELTDRVSDKLNS
jgi:hypothetical protein